MTERTLAASRPILIALLLAVGLLAAGVPTFLAAPASEHPALRGLAAILIAFMAALVLAARWGGRGRLAPPEHLLELGKIAAVVTTILLPALFAGMSTSETEALSVLTQSWIGWKSPSASWKVGLFLLGLTYVVFRLKSSVKVRRLSGAGLVAVALLVASSLVLIASMWVLQVPTWAGFELLQKVVLTMFLATLVLTARAHSGEVGRKSDPRSLTLAAGLMIVGLVTVIGTHLYLRPGADDIERVLLTYGDGKRTTFAAEVGNRPDVYGLFSLDYASASPRLEFLRPRGIPLHLLIEKVVGNRFGTARLEPRAQPASDWSELRPPPPEESAAEVWIRTRWWPRLDLRTGVRIKEPIVDWALSSDGTFAVASSYVGSPDAWPSHFLHQMDRGTYEVNLWRGSAPPRKLVDNLPLPPRILNLTERSVTLLVHGQSYSRGRLRTASAAPALRRDGVRSAAQAFADGFVPTTSYAPAPMISAVTRCDLQNLTCEPWILEDGDRESPGPGDFRHELGSGTLKAFLRLPTCPGCRSEADLLYLLNDGRVVRIALLGDMPNWDARLWTYDTTGRETATISLGNVRMHRFAGELSSDEVAFAWRAQYGYGRMIDPVWGWTLEAWNTSTGERRRLAADLATLPTFDDDKDASTIFLDREGRLVAPAIDGVRILSAPRRPSALR